MFSGERSVKQVRVQAPCGSSQEREGSPAPSFLEQGEQAWRDPGFSFFPAEPEPNTWRVLVRMACGHWFPARGAHGCGLDFTVMLN